MVGPFRTTVTGSYPRPVQPADTLKKPTLSREASDEMIRWAVRDQAETGLDIVTDGEVRRENMYYFFQKRLDGLSFDQMEYRSYGKARFAVIGSPFSNHSRGLGIQAWSTRASATPCLRRTEYSFPESQPLFRTSTTHW